MTRLEDDRCCEVRTKEEYRKSMFVLLSLIKWHLLHPLIDLPWEMDIEENRRDASTIIPINTDDIIDLTKDCDELDISSSSFDVDMLDETTNQMERMATKNEPTDDSDYDTCYPEFIV